MKNIFFMIISSFLPLTLLNLFAEANPSAQPQREAPAGKGLESYSLPSGNITEDDIPRIKTVIQQVLNKISESRKSSKKRSDYQAIKSGILTFQDWLKVQGCVNRASSPYDLEATDKYPENIFVPYPGQLPLDIVFKMERDMKQYRLMIFVSAVDFLDFGSLVENKSIGGVPALKNWPSSYMETRPKI